MLFAGPMVNAIRSNIKTQTRRLIKAGFDCNDMEFVQTFNHGDHPAGVQAYFGEDDLLGVKFPYGRPGGILWVRETYLKYHPVDESGYTDFGKTIYHYCADGPTGVTWKDADGFEEENQKDKWKPNIHMPFIACREFLHTKSISVQRLLTISDSDALKEGVIYDKDSGYYFVSGTDVIAQSPTEAYLKLWDSINGKDSHTLNPWVWVIEFERITKEQAYQLLNLPACEVE